MARAVERDGLEILSEAEARWLLTQTSIGRVSVPVDGVGVILPVTYLCFDDRVLFFSGAGSKLRAAEAHTLVSFEADDYDEIERTGWSVVVTGFLEVVTWKSTIVAAEEAGLRPWADGDRSHLLGIVVQSATGRRILPSRSVC